MLRQLFFFDTETTGISAESDQIIQFAAIYGKYDDEEHIFYEERTINQFINCDTAISEGAFNVHGITKEFISKFLYIQDYIKEFLAYINKSDYIICHNAAFDVSMLKWEMFRLSMGFKITTKEFCTMKQTADILKIPKGGSYKNPKLSELYQYCFGKDFENAHDAMSDIRATAECFFELYKTNKIILS